MCPDQCTWCNILVQGLRVIFCVNPSPRMKTPTINFKLTRTSRRNLFTNARSCDSLIHLSICNNSVQQTMKKIDSHTDYTNTYIVKFCALINAPNVTSLYRNHTWYSICESFVNNEILTINFKPTQATARLQSRKAVIL